MKYVDNCIGDANHTVAIFPILRGIARDSCTEKM